MSTSRNTPLIYAVTVLLITWLITGLLFTDPSVGKDSFSVIMFIPAIMIVMFNKFQHKRLTCFRNRINMKALLFSICYPLLFIVFCALVAGMTGVADFISPTGDHLKSAIVIAVTLLVNMASVLGEEYGWRGYLLPELTYQYGKTKATVMVGAIWALYHMPAVYLLARATDMAHPLLLCVIQACVVFTVSFPFSYCYYLSGNLVPVLVFHAVWNTFNTKILGDIYTNKQGVLDGNLLLINGEGIFGLVLGALLISFFIKQFKKNRGFYTAGPATIERTRSMRRA